jgi:hypothetical protein
MTIQQHTASGERTVGESRRRELVERDMVVE